AARLQRPSLRAGRFLPDAGAEGDLRELGAHRQVPRLPGGVGQTLHRGRLHRRLLLDDHRMKQATERAVRPNSFDLKLARARCKKYRRRILDMSQHVSALHIGGAFSCTEIVDCVYNELMRPGKPGGKSPDTFLMSK